MADKWNEAKQGDILKLEEGERAEGLFKGIEQSKTYPKSYALTLEIKKENKVIFVSDIVKELLVKNNIVTGQEIALLYVGLVRNKANTFSYKDYKLFFK